ncbi:hypothetical protein [Vibrio jasicida]|uniref:hypothetical protein n=1 Tax=Vibrio jasicida TaxID=766224 RepID=UPI0003A55CD5|nr:hypothetical protein [Vibrio jasicida]
MKKLELVVSNVKNAVVNKKTAVGSALTLASVSPAFAETPDITGAITSAISGGQSNVALVVAGLIGMAALGFGVTMVVGFLRR